MKRALVNNAVVLVAAAGICCRQAPVRYETVRITHGPITARVTATGTLSALVTVQVGSQVSGRISEIKVDFNSPVKRGKVIARIDSQLFEAAVENARANLAAAGGQLQAAKVNAKNSELARQRSRQLRQQKLIAQADLDTAEANADAAAANVAALEGQVQQAKAQLHQAEVNLNYTTIISPTDGVVISRAVDVGQTVAASFQSPTLFTIAQDLTKMQVDTSVAEADVGKLKPQMVASFTVDAYPNDKFKGTVRQIRNAPQTVQNVVTYDAVIDVDNTDLRLKPGMTANVTFVYAEKLDVLRVPNAAMRFKPPPELLQPPSPPAASSGSAVAARRPPPTLMTRPTLPASSDRRQVWVLRGERPQPLSIRVGVSDGTLSEVSDGELNDGDAVITDVLGGKGGAMPGGPRFRGF
jgi:HlyD family secretion protein